MAVAAALAAAEVAMAAETTEAAAAMAEVSLCNFVYFACVGRE